MCLRRAIWLGLVIGIWSARAEPGTSPEEEPPHLVAPHEQYADWSPAVNGLRGKLFIDRKLARKVGPQRALVFEIIDVSSEQILVPAWACSQKERGSRVVDVERFLLLDIHLAGHPLVESPPRCDASGAYLRLEPSERFSMNVSKHFSMGTGCLEDIWLLPYDPAGQEFGVSVTFENDVETMNIGNDVCPIWTGSIQTSPIQLPLSSSERLDVPTDSTSMSKLDGRVVSETSAESNGLTLKLESPKAVYQVGEKVIVDLVFAQNISQHRKIPVEQTGEGPFCDCTFRSPEGTVLWSFWNPERSHRASTLPVSYQESTIPIDGNEEVRLSVDLGRYKVHSPSHFYRPIGDEAITFLVTCGIRTRIGISYVPGTWTGGVQSGPLQLTVRDPFAPSRPPGAERWPPAVGRAKALADISAGRFRLLNQEAPETGLKAERLVDAVYTLDLARELRAYNQTVRRWAASLEGAPMSQGSVSPSE